MQLEHQRTQDENLKLTADKENAEQDQKRLLKNLEDLRETQKQQEQKQQVVEQQLADFVAENERIRQQIV